MKKYYVVATKSEIETATAAIVGCKKNDAIVARNIERCIAWHNGMQFVINDAMFIIPAAIAIKMGGRKGNRYFTSRAAAEKVCASIREAIAGARGNNDWQSVNVEWSAA